MPTDNDHPPDEFRILHLSDLHFTDAESATLWHGQLAEDLKDDLDCGHLDLLILSGDIGTRAEDGEYKTAARFLDQLRTEFKIDQSRIVMVPGNHDLNWKLSRKGYRFDYREDLQEPHEDRKGDRVRRRLDRRPGPKPI